MQQSRTVICTAMRSTTWKISCRGFARIRSREAPINPKSEASLAAAAARALKIEQTPTDAEDRSSDSSRTPFEDTPFFAKASKIISDMSLKTTNLSSTSIKEGELEEGNSWNWVPPRDGGEDTSEIIPVIKGCVPKFLNFDDSYSSCWHSLTYRILND